MKSSAIVLLLVLMSLASVSVVVMNNGHDAHQSGCIGSLVSVIDCPLSAISTVIHHIAGYNAVSQVPLALIGFVLLVLLLAFALFDALGIPIREPTYAFSLAHAAPRGRTAVSRWLALLEHSSPR